jgi:flagella basal body P-ring formation protein FlgA
MMRTVAIVVLVAIAWSAPAAGRPSRKRVAILASVVADPHRDAVTAVDARVRATLPAELGLAHTRLPASWALGPSDAVAVAWLSAPHAGWVNVQVTITQPSGARSVGWAQVELLPMRDVLVAARALTAGERLDAAALATDRRLVTADAVTLPPPALDGALVARDVAAGATLGGADVVLPPPVAQGAPVEVRLQQGALVITAHGVLERASHPGERTSARLVEGGHLVSGQLANPHTLVIEVMQ